MFTPKKKLILAAVLSGLCLTCCGDSGYSGQAKFYFHKADGTFVSLEPTDTFEVREYEDEIYVSNTAKPSFFFYAQKTNEEGVFKVKPDQPLLNVPVQDEYVTFTIRRGKVTLQSGKLTISLTGHVDPRSPKRGARKPLFFYRFNLPTKERKSARKLAEPASFEFENEPANLRKLLAEIHRAVARGDRERAGRLTASLVPGRAGLQKALRSGIPTTVMSKVLGAYAGAAPSIPEAARMATRLVPPAKRSVCRVHGATAQEIAAGAREFPGGAKRMAKSYLRPGMKFYEVEYTEPGKDMGTKFHLFYWDGAGWKTLGPLWRVL